MSADPLQLLFQVAHTLRPDELGHAPLRALEPGTARTVRLWWKNARSVHLSATGSIQVGNKVFHDMEEVETVVGPTAVYRPPGYGKPLLVGRAGRRVHGYRFFLENWYEFTRTGPKLAVTDSDWLVGTLKPLPSGRQEWLPVLGASRTLALGTLDDDGDITLNNPACERILRGAKALYVTPAGDVLRSAGSEVTAIGELLPRPERYFRKRLRVFAYREGTWLELVSARQTGANTSSSRRDMLLSMESPPVSETPPKPYHPKFNKE